MDLQEKKVSELVSELLTIVNLLKGKDGSPKEMGKQIIVLHRGWVIAGHVTIIGETVYVKDSQCIRRWGRPLGELATLGKTNDTILECKCQEAFPLVGVIKFIKIEEESDLI